MTRTPKKEQMMSEPAATGKEVVPAGAQTGLMIADDDFFGGMTGLENVSSADVSLPRWTVLQGLSPQVNSRKDEYVEGAKIGMLYNTATSEIAEQKDFVFAAYERRFVEWTPREQKSACPFPDLPKPYGGGLYQDYGTDDSIVRQCQTWEENGSLWTPRGNELLETGTWYCIDPDTLATSFIAMARTQFTSSKKLMAGIRDEKVLVNGQFRPAMLFYRCWTLSSKLRQKDDKEWFVFAHKPSIPLQSHPNGRAILGAVRQVQDQVREQTVMIDVSAGESDASPVNSGDNAAM